MTNHNKPILDWIEESGARHLATVDGPGDSTLKFYSVKNGRLFIVQFFEKNEGWEAFIPADTSNSTPATLAALDAYSTR